LSNGAYTSGWAERFWLVLSPGFLSSPAACGCSAYVDLVLPLALMSDIHDWAGLALGFFVAAHLFLNGAWILTMTRKILTKEPFSP
jgi:hypothetical protein